MRLDWNDAIGIPGALLMGLSLWSLTGRWGWAGVFWASCLLGLYVVRELRAAGRPGR